jgi:peptidoglycan hydrolase-like protein with peptidoglycan-binding domain
MKKSVFIILAIAVVVYLAGCGKKQQTLEEMQEPMSMEALSTLGSETKNLSEAKTQELQAGAVSPAQKLEPLPPPGPYKPSAIEIQTALKNAGYYTGDIDGKIGSKTKAAIEEFQKANGLKVDGRVGSRTWALLSPHLNPAPSAKKAKKR